MKRLVLLILVCLNSFCAIGQSAHIELQAFTFFLETIVPAEFPEGLKFEFRKKTEKEFTKFGINDDCFHKDTYTFLKKLDSAASDQDRRFHDELDIKLSKGTGYVKRTSKRKLRIFKATELNQLFYVELRLTIRNEGMISFFLELDKTAKVMRYCKAVQIF